MGMCVYVCVVVAAVGFERLGGYMFAEGPQQKACSSRAADAPLLESCPGPILPV
jgi:hypothetical protein